MQVCLAFNPQSTLVATGSMDATAKLWDVESGEEVATLSVREFFLYIPYPSASPAFFLAGLTSIQYFSFISKSNYS